METKEMTKDKDLRELIIEGIQDRKGSGITVVDMSEIEGASANYFVIAEGKSSTQTAAISDSVEEYVRLNGHVKPFGVQGAENGEWVIMDYGDTWVHIFLPMPRALYNLEDLWSDAKITHIPDLD